MKKCFVFLCMLICNNAIAQSSLTVHTQAELKEGDQMPDIELGAMINNYTGKSNFAQFRGQLVILDFWSTYCSACLELMPHMAALQKEFGDSIQVILVNPREDTKQIEERFNKIKYTLPPTLPSIVAANKLDTLFTTPGGHPHHVWIDEKGKILMRASHLSTYKQKIRDYFSGKKLFRLRDENTSIPFDENKPYNQLLGDPSTPPLQYGSFFTAFNNEYASQGGGFVKEIIDSAAGTIRSSFVNRNVLELFTTIFKDTLEKDNSKLIYSTDLAGAILLVKDTLRYTSYLIADHTKLIDSDFIKSKFCYEQVLPMNMPAYKRKRYMLDDLNRYFGSLYGTEGRLEKRKISCYSLIRTSDIDKLSTKSKGDEQKIVEKNIGHSKISHYYNWPLKSVVIGSIASLFYKHRLSGKLPEFLLNETGISKNVDIALPAGEGVKSINDLRFYLNKYDLDIVKVERELTVLVIEEK